MIDATYLKSHRTATSMEVKKEAWTPDRRTGIAGGGLSKVERLLGDRGYDADWFREALKDRGIRACIPGRKQRETTVKYDKCRYKLHNRIEIMFSGLRYWRRVATRYDRCPKVFLSAIAFAATVIYWL